MTRWVGGGAPQVARVVYLICGLSGFMAMAILILGLARLSKAREAAEGLEVVMTGRFVLFVWK